jgi:hypothetical protein
MGAWLVAVAWLLKPVSPEDRRTTTPTNGPPLEASVPSPLPSSPLDVPGSLQGSSLPETNDASVNPAPPADDRSPAVPTRKTARLVRPKFPNSFRGTVIVREQVLVTAKKPLSGQSFHWEAPAVPPLAHASAL